MVNIELVQRLWDAYTDLTKAAESSTDDVNLTKEVQTLTDFIMDDEVSSRLRSDLIKAGVAVRSQYTGEIKMATLDKYNIVKITEEALLATLKENVINNIVGRMVVEFKERAKEEVEKEVEKLSIDGV